MYKIHDIHGEWFQNTGRFTLVDPLSNTRFEPGEIVKAKATAWVLNQPTIKNVEGPQEKPPSAPPAPAPAPAPKPAAKAKPAAVVVESDKPLVDDSVEADAK
jgi:hypothetical protein